MIVYIVDAFTDKIFRGNQAGVVLLGDKEDFPKDGFMKSLAAELKHSETAYVKRTAEKTFTIRYFTPVAEVDLCGHATISAFTVMREMHYIGTGEYRAQTLAGSLSILVESGMIWMDMAKPRRIYDFSAEEGELLYSAFGLREAPAPAHLQPVIVNTGLSDILLPVADGKTLNSAIMDWEKVIRLSEKYGAVGIHMYCLGGQEHITAYCRNFAPLYGISEESATGTSNGALTYYLKEKGRITDGSLNTFLQGQAMGRESSIYTVIEGDRIRVGGTGRISMECRVWGTRFT